MRVTDGKSIDIGVSVFRNADGSIHMTSRELIKGKRSFHVAVNEDPTRKNGHPTLYKRLDALLAKAGV